LIDVWRLGGSIIVLVFHRRSSAANNHARW